MKKDARREKVAPVPEENLAWAKGGSGYVGSSGVEEPPPPDPDPNNPGGGT